MISALISRLVLLVCGTLYPAYASYKTVKTKNVRDYVKWMMYWIVFAAFTFIEIFTDIFLAFWFPFYYELKIMFVLWLVCPATQGSKYLFRKVVNPQLSKYEVVIDSYIAATWNHCYDLIRKVGTQGMDYIVEKFFELLRQGQGAVTNSVLNINEIAQNAAPPGNNPPSNENVTDFKNLDEDFIIMTDYSETDDNMPSSLSKPSQSGKDSCSESEELVETIPISKMKTRNKKKVTTVRERRKNDKK